MEGRHGLQGRNEPVQGFRRHRAVLRQDYGAMQAMLFGTIPHFDEILAELTELEQAMNALPADHP